MGGASELVIYCLLKLYGSPTTAPKAALETELLWREERPPDPLIIPPQPPPNPTLEL